MPTEEWMAEVNDWALTRAKLRSRIRDATRDKDSDTGHYEGGSYVWNLLIAIDQLGNAITGGNADETISSRLGKAKLVGDLNVAQRALDAFLEMLDDNHSIDAIEHDEGIPVGVKYVSRPGRLTEEDEEYIQDLHRRGEIPSRRHTLEVKAVDFDAKTVTFESQPRDAIEEDEGRRPFHCLHCGNWDYAHECGSGLHAPRLTRDSFED